MVLRYNRNYVEAKKRSQDVIEGRRLTILQRSFTLLEVILMLFIAPFVLITAKILDWWKERGGKP